jgi:hypothetical protein
LSFIFSVFLRCLLLLLKKPTPWGVIYTPINQPVLEFKTWTFLNTGETDDSHTFIPVQKGRQLVEKLEFTPPRPCEGEKPSVKAGAEFEP